MSDLDRFRLLSRYNRWMNGKVYEAAARLSAEEVARDRGAFFGSILGTLNHLVVADTIWLKRLARHPGAAALARNLDDLEMPAALDAVVETELSALRRRRDHLDDLIDALTESLVDDDLAVPLAYRRINGEANHKRLGDVLAHLFNHQTHHRGQVTTLLTQAGVDVGVTDLLVLLPDVA
jgi:Uncharacterized protein conserved in bacteria